MTRTFSFAFDPEPEGGFTVTCPALPGLVTYGVSLEAAKVMAQDAMDGLIEVMLERGETLPDSDAPEVVPRFDRLAHMPRNDDEAKPIFEQLSASIDQKI